MMRNWLLLLASAAGLAYGQPPALIEITYELTRNGSPMAEIVERLEQRDGGYRLTETWKGRGFFALLGTARRYSQGSVTPQGLQPKEFFDERSGRDTARAWFDWQAKTLTMQYKGARRSEPLPPNAQDRLSFFFALSFLPGNGDTVTFSIADGRGLSRHEYRVVGKERIRVPAGEFEAVKIARHSSKRETAFLWLAADRWNLPVRLFLVDKDGAQFDQVATRITRP